jgi:membrane-bound lytic murein transglycosylase B
MSPKQLIDRWSPLIKEASRRFGVAEDWIRAVMRMESGGRTVLDDKRPITSKAGAMGVMQVMPDTYRDMQQQYGLGADPYDPHDNVLAGAAYLHWLQGKYGYPKMFAAYNAGPGRVEAQSAGLQLPDETRAYVSGITRILGGSSNSAPPAKLQVVSGPATLTRPDGSPVSIDGAKVDSIRASMPDEYAPGVRTVVAMGTVHQGVTEDPATVASLLRTHGAKV